LGNSECCNLHIEGLDGNLNVSNAIERLHDSETFTFVAEDLTAFATTHFYHFYKLQFYDVSLSTFIQILLHPSLRIKDDDSLDDLLSQHFETSHIYFSVVENLPFEFVSQDRISRSISFSSNHFEAVNLQISNPIYTDFGRPSVQNCRIFGYITVLFS
jgi:hypothetical protein